MSFSLHFHPRSGWMNDPNGLIQRHGLHHLFFQHNPEGPFFGRIHWGHATSTDLVSWTEQRLALIPGDGGDYDADGCFSGCTVALPGGAVAAVYSANRDGRQLPAVAFSDDGDLGTWQKVAGNPVVGHWPPIPGLTDLRDHSVVAEGRCWRQVLGAGRDTALARSAGELPVDGGRGGLLVSYLSDGDDLTAWTFAGVLLDGREADLPGEVWECPDLFVADGVPEGEAALIFSWYTRDPDPDGPIHSDVVWLTGSYRQGRLVPARFGRLDLGNRFYAPQSYTTSDERRIMFGWLRTQLDPASEGGSTVGAASLPRQLRVVAGQLHQALPVEVTALARTPLGVLDARQPTLDLREPVATVEFTVRVPDAEDLPEVVFQLVGADGAATVVSLAAFGAPSRWVRHGGRWVTEPSVATRARVLVDAGLVEIFTEDGRAAATSGLALTSVSRVAMPAGQRATITVSAVQAPTRAENATG